MKAIRQIIAAALALAALASCSKEEANTDGQDGVDNGGGSGSAYASISSDSDGYTANSGGGSILFGPAGGQVIISVNADVDWNVAQEGTDWLDIGVATSTGRVTVIASQSTEEADRTAALTFYKTSDGSSFAVVDITQTAYDRPELGLDSDSWHAPAKGALTTTIAVQANVDWSVTEVSDNWLSAQKTEDGLLLAAEENGDYEIRDAEVTLTCTDGITSATQAVRVYQDGAAYLDVGTDYLSFGSDEASETVAVESNYEWGFSYDSSVDWLSAEAGEGGLTLTVAKYEESGTRECTLTLIAGDGAENVAEAQLTVAQKGSNPAMLILEYTVGDRTTVALPLYGTVNCTVDWDDGNVETVTSTTPTHTYADAGVYQVGVLGTVTQLKTTEISSSMLPYLTGVVQWGTTGLTSMEYALYKSTGVTHLPADTEGSFAKVTTFAYAFQGCTALETVDAGLFAYATACTTYQYTFNGDTSLVEVPAGLFDSGGEVTMFTYTFQGCTSLKTIPDGMLDNCPKVTRYILAFDGCSSLEKIPAGLFDASGSTVVSFQGTFYGCSSITEIPAGLFDKNTACSSFYETFRGCTRLSTVPEGLFANNTKATSFYGLFNGCSSLAEVPADLFATNSAVTTVAYLFANCSSLTSLPEGLFDAFEKLTTTTGMMQKCTSLTTVPASLFDNCKKLATVNLTFDGCTALTSESPYTVIDGKKVHLYERADYPDEFATFKSYGKCFNGCTSMSDYSDAKSAGWAG